MRPTTDVLCRGPRAPGDVVSTNLPPDWKPDERLIRGVLLLLERAHRNLDEMGFPKVAPRPDRLERSTW